MRLIRVCTRVLNRVLERVFSLCHVYVANPGIPTPFVNSPIGNTTRAQIPQGLKQIRFTSDFLPRNPPQFRPSELSEFLFILIGTLILDSPNTFHEPSHDAKFQNSFLQILIQKKTMHLIFFKVSRTLQPFFIPRNLIFFFLIKNRQEFTVKYVDRNDAIIFFGINRLHGE